MPSVGRLLGLAAAVALLSVATATKDAAVDSGVAATLFDKVDSNHDGNIDRGEFGALEASDKQGVLKGAFNKIAKTVGFVPAFLNGITMIIATELGDKTFCIAAVMAMRYNRLFVFLGGIGALFVMTILSVGIGVAVPALLPKVYTHYAAAALFAYFGVKLLREASQMSAGPSEELAEAEAEVAEAAGKGSKSDSKEDKEGEEDASGSAGATAAALTDGSAADDAESGAVTPSSATKRYGNSGAAGAAPGKSFAAAKPEAANAAAILVRDWPIFTQAFTITFLAEWGDRSQIATIAMAAAQDPLGIAVGGVIGHSLCTGLAVIGGRLLASRISERAVAYTGGALFLLFALHSFVMGPEVDE